MKQTSINLSFRKSEGFVNLKSHEQEVCPSFQTSFYTNILMNNTQLKNYALCIIFVNTRTIIMNYILLLCIVFVYYFVLLLYVLLLCIIIM